MSGQSCCITEYWKTELGARRFDLARAIVRAIELMPGKQRNAFIWKRYRNLSEQEIAERMECSRGEVDRLIASAERLLYHQLQQFSRPAHKAIE